ncbi:unnamed protein product [Hymenolepis diminuta]|uniref:Dynein light chain n=1 Tax=Hymenolepis diminuta TaxID=6216 RepID=A0A0R3SQ01_HYMDI|nr:unnamed protein product [Hymenolepis diminuta]
MMNTICRPNSDPRDCSNKPRFVRCEIDDKDQSYFLKIVYEACQCYDDPVDLCTAIKQCLDRKFGPMWHVVVGPEFGSAACNRDYSDSKPHFLRKSLDPEEESNFLYIVRSTYTNYDDPEDMCTALKRRLDDEYGPTWHVIVGDSFGSHFEHDPKMFCYITYMGLSFLMFRFG